jgi:lipoprotein-anchoring transpeptidase ErfK/SrfK
MRFASLFRLGLVAAGLVVAPSAFAYMTYPSSPTYPPDVNTMTYGRPMVSAIPRETVSYYGPYAPGTIIISTSERRLYLVLPDHQALKYGVGVGRPGFTWGGNLRVSMKKEWPSWTPPAAMLRRRPDLPRYMKGGIDNPLGARALYLGSSEYRIHGSNEPDTIGTAVSSGCIRMTNDDVKDLYERVPVGTRVIVQN